MEKSRMNLPKGPDTLCFDKDEFMKVRARPRSPSRLLPPCLGPRPRETGPRRDLAALAVSLSASGVAGADWRKRVCEVARSVWKGLEVLDKWF